MSSHLISSLLLFFLFFVSFIDPPKVHKQILDLEENNSTLKIATEKILHQKYSIQEEKVNGSVNPTSAKSVYDPTVGQVVYGMYLLHCCTCVQAYSMCTFPGCSYIRSSALAEVQEEWGLDEGGGRDGLGGGSGFTQRPEMNSRESREVGIGMGMGMGDVNVEGCDSVNNSNSMRNTPMGYTKDKCLESEVQGPSQRETKSVPDLISVLLLHENLLTTGDHPIEKAIRKYLLNSTVDRSMQYDAVENSVACIEYYDGSYDRDNRCKKEINEELRVVSSEVQLSGSILRFLHRRLVSSSVGHVMTGEEVINLNVIR